MVQTTKQMASRRGNYLFQMERIKKAVDAV